MLGMHDHMITNYQQGAYHVELYNFAVLQSVKLDQKWDECFSYYIR